MPKYKVQLKQGSRTIVEHIEAKSVGDVKMFYSTLTTMKVSEILKIEFEDNTKPPIDDFNYWSLFKGIVANSERMSQQIIIHNIKLSKNEKDIAMACQTHLEVNSLNVKSIMTGLFKK